jgi:hypothetical protein
MRRPAPCSASSALRSGHGRRPKPRTTRRGQPTARRAVAGSPVLHKPLSGSRARHASWWSATAKATSTICSSGALSVSICWSARRSHNRLCSAVPSNRPTSNLQPAPRNAPRTSASHLPHDARHRHQLPHRCTPPQRQRRAGRRARHRQDAACRHRASRTGSVPADLDGVCARQRRALP